MFALVVQVSVYLVTVVVNAVAPVLVQSEAPDKSNVDCVKPLVPGGPASRPSPS